jgi:DNA-binding LacI/PurR family transcriptional regulator
VRLSCAELFRKCAGFYGQEALLVPRSTPIQPPRRVLLIISTTFAPAHQVIRGVTAYAHERGPAWELLFRSGQSVHRRIEMFAPNAQAAIIQVQGDEILKAVKLIQGPVVLANQPPQAGLPLVRADNRAVGRMAFEHLAGQGFKHFAYWGEPEVEFSRLREEGFHAAVKKAGFPFYPQPGSRVANGPACDPLDKPNHLCSIIRYISD